MSPLNRRLKDLDDYLSPTDIVLRQLREMARFRSIAESLASPGRTDLPVKRMTRQARRAVEKSMKGMPSDAIERHVREAVRDVLLLSYLYLKLNHRIELGLRVARPTIAWLYSDYRMPHPPLPASAVRRLPRFPISGRSPDRRRGRRRTRQPGPILGLPRRCQDHRPLALRGKPAGQGRRRGFRRVAGKGLPQGQARAQAPRPVKRRRGRQGRLSPRLAASVPQRRAAPRRLLDRHRRPRTGRARRHPPRPRLDSAGIGRLSPTRLQGVRSSRRRGGILVDRRRGLA